MPALVLCLTAGSVTGCGVRIPGNPGAEISVSSVLAAQHEADYGLTDADVADREPVANPYPDLSVPTYIGQIDGLWFIVDCYHDQVIYSDSLDKPLTDWKVMTSQISKGHTVASDGTVYLVDDTENNRVLVFEKRQNAAGEPVFLQTQTLEGIGDHPHYIVYHEEDKTFYCWSSWTDEMFLLKRTGKGPDISVSEVRMVPRLESTYVRSFTIAGDSIYFVSGLPSPAAERTTAPGMEEQLAAFHQTYVEDMPEQTPASIVQCDLKTFEVQHRYTVSGQYAGMAQIQPVEGAGADAEVAGTDATGAGADAEAAGADATGAGAGANAAGADASGAFLVTVSTDDTGSQDAATMLYVQDLQELSTYGKPQVIYDTYFCGGGTPYFMTQIDDTYYLTEHRLPAHAIWSFRMDHGQISDVQSIY